MTPSYDIDSAEILRRLSSKPKRMVELDEVLKAVCSHLDRRPASVRAAIARKRVAPDAEDRRRFIAATAHMPDSEFLDCTGRPIVHTAVPSHLLEGCGSRRRRAFARMMRDERHRRAARTAHEVLAERSLRSTLMCPTPHCERGSQGVLGQETGQTAFRRPEDQPVSI